VNSMTTVEEVGTSSLNVPVLLMARELGWGGIERDVSKYARHLSRYGIQPHVACFRPGGIRWCEIESAGVPVIEVPIRSFKSRDVLVNAKMLKTYIREHRIQVLHTFDNATNLFGALLTRILDVPIFLSSQLCYRELFSFNTRLLLALTDRLATGLFVNCQAVADYLISNWRVPAQRIRVCHNGFEEEEFHPEDRTRPEMLTDASVVIGTVAVLREEKGLMTLVDAFAQVRRIDPRARLLIVGDGPMKPALAGRTRDLGIDEACFFENATRTPANWMRAIDLFVLPSRSEAFPNALLESMACGCCPVASRIGGIPELIHHGQNGVLFESGNAQELAEVLCSLANDRLKRQTLAHAATLFAHEHLTIDRAAARLASIYKDLLFRRGRRERERRCRV